MARRRPSYGGPDETVVLSTMKDPRSEGRADRPSHAADASVPKSGRRLLIPVLATFVAVGLVAGGFFAAQALRGRDTDKATVAQEGQGTSTPTAQVVASPTTSEPSVEQTRSSEQHDAGTTTTTPAWNENRDDSTSTVGPQGAADTEAGAEAAAKTELEAYLAQDSLRVGDLIASRAYVAMLASKTDGTRDNLQQAPVTGGHVFGWRDILAEHRSLRDDAGLRGRVYLADSSRYGGRRVDPNSGRPYMVTVYDGGFSDRGQVVTFCQSHFSHLGAAERANACAPSRMQVG